MLFRMHNESKQIVAIKQIGQLASLGRLVVLSDVSNRAGS